MWRSYAFGEVRRICEISGDVLIAVRWFNMLDQAVDMEDVMNGLESPRVVRSNDAREQMWTFMNSIVLTRDVFTPTSDRNQFVLSVMT
jgi:hypothetical protein